MQLVFNELSTKDIPQERDAGERIFEQFITTYHRAVTSKYGFLREIRTCENLNNAEIAKGYYAFQWRNKIEDRDLARRFGGICERQIVAEMNEDEIELNCCKGSGKGLLSAYINNDVAISMTTDEIWNEFNFEAEFYELTTDASRKVQIYNLTKEDQLNTHSLQIDSLNSYKTGKDVLRDIDKIFPSLIFHIKAKNQLDDEVEPQHIPMIVKRLKELEEFFSEWNGGQIRIDDFQSKMSPESTQTLEMFRKEHTFNYNGEDIIVSYHLRYTGNLPGRVYFYPDAALKKGLICSLTTKLKTVTDRKI